MIITFIGGGNMATALISGLRSSVGSGLGIRVSDPSEEARNRLHTTYGAEPFTDSVAAISDVDIIVLAVKPQVMTRVLAQLAGNGLLSFSSLPLRLALYLGGLMLCGTLLATFVSLAFLVINPTAPWLVSATVLAKSIFRLL